MVVLTLRPVLESDLLFKLFRTHLAPIEKELESNPDFPPDQYIGLYAQRKSYLQFYIPMILVCNHDPRTNGCITRLPLAGFVF